MVNGDSTIPCRDENSRRTGEWCRFFPKYFVEISRPIPKFWEDGDGELFPGPTSLSSLIERESLWEELLNQGVGYCGWMDWVEKGGGELGEREKNKMGGGVK